MPNRKRRGQGREADNCVFDFALLWFDFVDDGVLEFFDVTK